MKSFAIFAAVAAVISGVSAQVAVGVDVGVNVAVGAGGGNPYPNCTSTSHVPGTRTITDITISTYCPVCDEARGKGLVYTTTYETIVLAVCPTGYSSATYTVTNICTGTTPINYSTCPPGYTTTAVVCSACPGAPTVVVTTPIAVATKCPGCVPVGTGPYIATLPYATAKPSNIVVIANGASSNLFNLGAMAAAGASVFLGMLLL